MRDLFIREVRIDWSRIGAGSYLRGIGALASAETLRFSAPVTFFAGENGSGKSTLLEAIAVASGFNAEGGTRNYRFSTYDDVSELPQALSLVRGSRRQGRGYFFRAESFFNVASAIMRDYNDDGKMPDYHVMSHGESFLSFLQGAEDAALYLMDEPEAALSPQRQLALLIHLARMAESGAQFIIATHSPILLGVPGAEILEFGDGGIRPCAWKETESFRITKMFLDDPERMLGRLLED